MLVEFSVENYRSIADKQTLSMVASREKNLLDNTFSVPNSDDLKLLKSAAIYGANASGKTNILRGLSVLKTLVLIFATQRQVNDKLEVEPFRLDQKWSNKETLFEIVFIQNKTKYEYYLLLDQNQIYEESLYAYPKNRKQIWYSREYNKNTKEYQWHFGSSLKGAKERIKSFVRPNSLFLSHAVQNNNEQLTLVFGWFAETLLIQEINFLESLGSHKTANFCLEDENKLQLIRRFMAIADIDIDNIYIEQKTFLENLQPSQKDIIEQLKLESNILDLLKTAKTYSVKTSRKMNDSEQIVYFDLEDESHGTQRLFSIIGDILDSFFQGKTIIIDELGKSLHPSLSKLITKIFNSEDNRENAQLILTTHDTTLLDRKIFRRDQIWFTEKNENRATELYSLVEFEEIENESLQKGYLQGRYGAIPFIGEVQF